MQILSSKYTFFYKFIFILIWIAGVLFFPQEYDLRWTQYAVTWGAIAVFIFFATGSIKTVAINRKKKILVVSNYFKTRNIDFAAIEDIDGSSQLSPKLVWFTLKEASDFGRKIIFLPAVAPQKSIGKHPIVIELRKEFQIDR